MVKNFEAFEVAISKKVNSAPNYIQLFGTCTCRLFHMYPLRYMYMSVIPNILYISAEVHVYVEYST